MALVPQIYAAFEGDECGGSVAVSGFPLSVLTIHKFRDCKNTTERLGLPRGCRGGVDKMLKMEKLVYNFVEAQM